MASPTAKDENKKKKEQEPQYNPRWLGYAWILMSSLVNCSAVSNIAVSSAFKGHPGIAAGFGVFTLFLCLVILFLDRFQVCIEKFNYLKAYDGNLEGGTLLGLVILWVVAVAFMTQVDGIGYLTLNIYFSSWATLFCCGYTLNKWSESKDILTFAELTGISATLKGWYILLFSSLVVFGTCINLLAILDGNNQASAVVGVTISLFTTITSLAMIAVHYNFIEFCTQGGWIEMSCCIVAFLVWVIAVAMLTQDGGVGATIVGTDCKFFNSEMPVTRGTSIPLNCTVVFSYVTTNRTFSPSMAPIIGTFSPTVSFEPTLQPTIASTQTIDQGITQILNSTTNSSSSSSGVEQSPINETELIDGMTDDSFLLNGSTTTLSPTFDQTNDTMNDDFTIVDLGDGDGNLIIVHEQSCQDVADDAIPGSNIYCFAWIALASTVYIGLRWKAQQALQFAQAQNKNMMRKAHEQEKRARQAVSADDDDLDDFEDANY